MIFDSAAVSYCLATLLVSVPATYFIASRTQRKNILIEAERDFERNRNELLDDAKTAFANDEGLQARLNNEYLKGKAVGQKEELEKFVVTYQPYTDVREEYMGIKKSAEVGYEMQISYGPFPIGDATRRVISTEVKFDQAVIDKIISSEVLGTINSVIQLAAKNGISTKVLPTKPPKTKK